MSVERMRTVAELVASLPPIPQLLGMAESSTGADLTAAGRGKGRHQLSARPRTDAMLKKNNINYTKTAGGCEAGLALPPLATSTSAGARSVVASMLPAAAVESARERVVADREAWKRIRHSLELPLVGRRHEDVVLTLSYLRRIPALSSSPDDDLLTLASAMELVHLPHAGLTAACVMTSGEAEARKLVGLLERLDLARSCMGVCADGDEDPTAIADDNARGMPRIGDRDTAAAVAAMRQLSELHRSMATQHVADGRSDSNGDSCEMSDAADTDTAAGAGADAEAAKALPEGVSVDPFLVLVDGTLLLELPTAVGRQHFPVLAGDACGCGRLAHALPVGARFVTQGPCLLLQIRRGEEDCDEANAREGNEDGDSGATATNTTAAAAGRASPLGTPLHAALAQIEASELHRRINFLTHRITPPLFRANSSTSGGPQSAETRSSLRALARGLVPLRLAQHQLLAAEGEAADAMFVITDGSVRVTRRVSVNGPSAAPAIAHAAAFSSSGMVIMEVATLQCGEVCGELGLLGHNPDVRPGAGVVWTDDYWRDALENRFRTAVTAVDGTNAQFLRDLHTSSREAAPTSEKWTANEDITASNAADHESPDPTESTADAVAAGTAPRSKTMLQAAEERALEREALFAPQPAARMATLSAHTASTVYRLPYDVCRAHLTSASVTRLREYAKGYSSHDDLCDRYVLQQRWDAYKRAVYREAVETANKKTP